MHLITPNYTCVNFPSISLTFLLSQWPSLQESPNMEVNCQKDHKTAINFSRLESFAIYIPLFRSFSLLGHMLSENASSDDVEMQQPSEEFLAQLLRLCVIDQVTQTVPKKRSKSGLYSVQGKIGIFWCRKIAKIGGKLWQLESIISLTEIHVRGHQIFDLKSFMTL